MSIEILIYLAVGILWLILQALGKKKKTQQTAAGGPQRPPVTLEEVLNEMEWIPGEQPSIPEPAPLEFQPIDAKPVQRVQPKAVLKVPIKREDSVEARPPVIEPSNLIRQLKDPQSAQTAVIVSEILGKPRAYRRLELRTL